MKPPKISIIIPVYNDELYLADLLQSVKNQTFIDFECLCVNDGSTDKTEEIIDQFCEKDSRFVKINRENGGVSAARNTGLDAATGEYLFFIDHDDLIPDYTLKKLFDAAEKFDADLSRGKFVMIAENFTLQQLPKENETALKSKFYTNPLTDYYRHVRGQYKQWYYVWQCLFKRAVIEEVRFMEDLRSGGEDFIFIFDAVAKIQNFVQIEDVVTCHRNSKISLTQNGYKPELFFNISEIVVPHIYQKYALDPNIDKRLRWWVYRKEAYAVYRFLLRNLFRKKNIDKKYCAQAREIILKMDGTPEFNEILKYLDFRQKLFFRLFIRQKYGTIQKLKIFL